MLGNEDASVSPACCSNLPAPCANSLYAFSKTFCAADARTGKVQIQGLYKDPRGAALSQGLFLPAVGVTFKASDTGKAVTMTVLLLP